MIVKLKKNDSTENLTAGQHYAVIGIEADDYRLLDDAGRPYLYDHALFEVVDATEPRDWVSESGDDGERYAYPRELNRTGFFEDFFEGDADAIALFWRTVNRNLASAG